jgi:hypothetical protein
MTKPNYQQANKRYHRLFGPAMLAYSICIVGGVFGVHATGPNNLIVRTLAGLAAAIPLIIAIWALLRFVRETDEFNRQMNLQALAFAGGVTASLAALVGFLQMYEVVPLFPAFWFVVFYFPAYGFGHLLTGKGATQCGPDEG